MKRNIWRVLLLLFLLMFTFTIFGCLFTFPEIAYQIKEVFVSKPPPDPLKSELTDAFAKYEGGEIPYVDMVAITTFDWDRLYVIGAYASPRELNSRFGWSWMSCSTNILYDDGISFLVFVKGNVIVHCMDYGPFNRGYDFSRLDDKYPDGISSQDALFILRGDNWRYVDLLNNK